jgi:CMP-N,N'-diacetyllegionaminic acid synthase
MPASVPPSVLALIPARGGSKGIPGKNLVPLAGRPLIAHTIACARAVPEIGRVIVSTDCDEIAQCATSLGAEVPFLRPPEISADDTPMLAVLQHLLGWLRAAGTAPEGIVLLQPTSPLRRPESIAAALALFHARQADSVVSVTAVPHHCTPGSLLRMDADGRVAPAFPEMAQALRRQDKPLFHARNGPAVLVLRPDVIDAGQLYTARTYGFPMSRRESFDIDEREDLAIAEALLR